MLIFTVIRHEKRARRNMATINLTPILVTNAFAYIGSQALQVEGLHHWTILCFV